MLGEKTAITPIREWVFSPLQLAWLDALESDEYRQTTGRLWRFCFDRPGTQSINFHNYTEFCHDKRSYFCCLGVAAVVAADRGVPVAKNHLAPNVEMLRKDLAMSNLTNLDVEFSQILGLGGGGGRLYMERLSSADFTAMKREHPQAADYILGDMGEISARHTNVDLVGLNDQRLIPFPTIAQFIRRFPHLVFDKPYVVPEQEVATC